MGRASHGLGNPRSLEMEDTRFKGIFGDFDLDKVILKDSLRYPKPEV